MLLKLFGPLRRYGDITLQLESAITVSEARVLLSKQLPDAPIIAQSAFADDERVLKDSDVLQPEARYSVLPPVAGG